MRNAVTALLGTFLLVVTSSVAIAQDSFTYLQTTLKAGDVVTITDDAGRQTRGTVEHVGTSILVLASGPSSQ
jgi:hypothetical protein